MHYESSTKEQSRILLIAISLVIAVAVIVLTLTLWMLYRSNFGQQLESLHAMPGGQVLAVFHPIGELHNQEVNAPFMKAAASALATAALVALAGGLLLRRIARPMVRHIEKSQQNFRALLPPASHISPETRTCY